MKRKIFLSSLISLVLLSGFQAAAQPALPVISVRFANPQYDCPTQTYCLDVQLRSDTPNLRILGINVRFFYDDDILEYRYLGDFATGYDTLDIHQSLTFTDDESIAYFGFSGPVEWFNGYVQLINNDTTYLSSDTSWTKLFNVCFHVDDPNSIGIDSFCPSIVWDMMEGGGGGYLQGDDGVAMTVVTVYPNSAPTTENVVQFNWIYAATDISVGHPEKTICRSTKCGDIIPISNWSLFLAIGLMLAASIFIYRRRISG